jgi:uncharacterized repeat protein (TIGR01451 family)
MLAFPHPKTIAVLLLPLTLLASVSWSQQTPASRYQPLGQPHSQNRTAAQQQGFRSIPPSVHVPPTAATRIQPSVSYSFSDGNRRGSADAGVDAGAVQAGLSQPATGVRQTAFESDDKNASEPQVPSILTQRRDGSSLAVPKLAPANPLPASGNFPPGGMQPLGQSAGASPPVKSPAQFANEMNSLRGPASGAGENDRVAQIRQEVLEMQRKMAEGRNQPPKRIDEPASLSNAGQPLEPLVRTGQKPTGTFSTEPTPPAIPETRAISSAQPQTPPRAAITPSEFPEGMTAGMAAGALPLLNTPSNEIAASYLPAPGDVGNVTPAAQQATNSLSTSFPGSSDRSPAEKEAQLPGGPEVPHIIDHSTAESFDDFMAFAKENRQGDPVVKQETEQPVDRNTVGSFPASSLPSATPTRFAASGPKAPETAIRLSMPTLSVETFGPQSIGIHRPCQFNIVVRNEGQTMAERVLVNVDIPAWVEIDKVNMTTGEKEIFEGQPLQRLLWRIDRIPPQSSQTITLTTIPRRAEVFDLGVEWTLVPRAGAAKINVTQPKLEMSIVGPEEVQFGDSATYQVTVRNSGTGNAENVTVILSEALNGDRGNLGDIPAGQAKSFDVTLVARTPGELDLAIQAISEDDVQTAASRKLLIRRANLEINISGPAARYAGTSAQYLVQIRNSGDAKADEVVAAMGLPKGVRFLGGLDSFKVLEGGLRWPVGSLEPGQSREYRIQCQLDVSGDVQLEVGTQGKGALQASHAMQTQVQTIADLAMTVNDPSGPLTTGEEITYEIVVHNRGTRAAKDVDVFMILSQGLEPKSGSGRDYRIPRDGAIQFATIPQIEPGEKVTLNVIAVASKPGTHVFRAHLVCEEADSREIKEGTSRFFGEEIPQARVNTANQMLLDDDSSSFSTEIKR